MAAPKGYPVDGGEPLTTIAGNEWVVDTPLPDHAATVRVRGHDEEGCITHWSEPAEVSWEACYPGAPVVVGVAPVSDTVALTPSLVITYNEAVYIGSPAGGLVAPQPSLSLPGPAGIVGFRAEAVVAITDTWALAVRYVPLWNWSVPSLAEWTMYTATVAGAMDAAAQAVTATWAFTTGDFTLPHVVGTRPEDESQSTEVPHVTAYLNEDVSTAGASFTLVGPGGPVAGTKFYYNAVPCSLFIPSCDLRFTIYDWSAREAFVTRTNASRGDTGPS